MLSNEFEEIFRHYPNINAVYIGTFSADRLPRRLKNCQFAIINTDLSTNEGIHWYVALRYNSKLLEVFDSLSIDNEKKVFLKNNLKLPGVQEIEFNTTQFQKNDSVSCGKHCIYFIINRLYNMDHSFKRLLSEIYSDDLSENERRVEEFYAFVKSS